MTSSHLENNGKWHCINVELVWLLIEFTQFLYYLFLGEVIIRGWQKAYWKRNSKRICFHTFASILIREWLCDEHLKTKIYYKYSVNSKSFAQLTPGRFNFDPQILVFLLKFNKPKWKQVLRESRLQRLEGFIIFDEK